MRGWSVKLLMADMLVLIFNGNDTMDRDEPDKPFSVNMSFGIPLKTTRWSSTESRCTDGIVVLFEKKQRKPLLSCR